MYLSEPSVTHAQFAKHRRIQRGIGGPATAVTAVAVVVVGALCLIIVHSVLSSLTVISLIGRELAMFFNGVLAVMCRIPFLFPSGGSRGGSGGSLERPLCPPPPQLVSVRPNYFIIIGYYSKMR